MIQSVNCSLQSKNAIHSQNVLLCFSMGLGFVQLTAIGVSRLAKTCVLRDLAFYLPVENTSHVPRIGRQRGGAQLYKDHVAFELCF